MKKRFRLSLFQQTLITNCIAVLSEVIDKMEKDKDYGPYWAEQARIILADMKYYLTLRE